MFRELIDKLKVKKRQLQTYKINNAIVQNKPIEEKIDIIISIQNNISKIEINDCISIIDFLDKKNSSDEYSILDLLCNCVLWNGKKQKVNKGTYYVITVDNRIYNILFTDERIKIDERTKIELDEQTQKENITQERVLTFSLNKNEYHYFSAKHESNGNTYYTKYYNKNGTYSLGNLDLTDEETYDEVNSVIYNLEGIEGIETILDVEFLKVNILEGLGKNLLPKNYKMIKKL